MRNFLNLVGGTRILSSAVKNRMVEVEQYRESIAKERDLIPDRLIFLNEEFFERAVRPLASGDLQFKLNHGAPVGNVVFTDFRTPKTHLVPKSRLQEGIVKDRVFKDIESQLNQRLLDIARINRAEGRDGSAIYWDDELVSLDDFKERFRSAEWDKIDEENVDGCSIVALEEYLESTGYDSYEALALLRGKGQNILEFWQAVRNLEPYQHLFPEDKPKSRTRRQRELSDQVQPAWGPATLQA